MMNLSMQAFLWGGIAGGALLIGAVLGYFVKMPKAVSSSVMSFGIGVLISALSFNLMHESFEGGGVGAAVGGFCVGALIYALASAALAKRGARSRKMSVGTGGGASLAIALGSLMDGIPEAAAIGTSLLDGEGVAIVTVMAIFVSNIPEGLSSSVGMKSEGRSTSYVFSIWGSIALACAVSSWLGFSVLGHFGPFYVAAALSAAAGAILVMLVDTMIPEAFEDLHAWSGFIAAFGFILAFCASHVIV